MRKILLVVMFVALLAGCSYFDDSVEEPMDSQPVAEESAAAEDATEPAEEAAPAPEQEEEATPKLKDTLPEGPMGVMQLKDGTRVEITELIKIKGYYMYVSGKLNGRSSTVVSFTRFRDLHNWGAITFKDQNTFNVTTKRGKELAFTNGRLYLGTDNPEHYAFITTNYNLDTVRIEVKKSEVALIKFN